MLLIKCTLIIDHQQVTTSVKAVDVGGCWSGGLSCVFYYNATVSPGLDVSTRCEARWRRMMIWACLAAQHLDALQFLRQPSTPKYYRNVRACMTVEAWPGQ